MKVALDRIDEVGKCEAGEPAVCDQKLQTAKAAILACEKKEVTAYDRQLVPLLDLQLDGAITEQKARSNTGTDPRYARQLVVVEESNHQSEMMLRVHLQ